MLITTDEKCGNCGAPAVKLIFRGRRPRMICVNMGCGARERTETGDKTPSEKGAAKPARKSSGKPKSKATVKPSKKPRSKAPKKTA
jgi:hypothetical protein